ncbi:Ku protein [Noviherbaspirillum saxi]|uniref:Ku domain-containing protein n=1 Tax=Noviherbaspirillum saxi TaxID=2320863 RepID=A0A3A3FUU8_9BURK|nr:hypothetical protein D3871_11720 [Noviherbaspirillum saxi]
MPINTDEKRERLLVIFPDTERCMTSLRPTHAVDILAFVEAQEIPSDYFETPYYLQPAPGGEKAYALLRETLRQSRKIGIAYVVIRTRQHLAALVPDGQSLVLNTLRWSSESGQARHFGLSENDMLAAQELAMMTAPVASPVRSGGTVTRHASNSAVPLANLEEAPEIVVEELDDSADEDNAADSYFAGLLKRSMHPRSPAIRHTRTSHRLSPGTRRGMLVRRG